jgi:hypothetical protein
MSHYQNPIMIQDVFPQIGDTTSYDGLVYEGLIDWTKKVG